MLAMNKKTILAASAVLLLLAGCAGGTLDDGDSADAVLEVENINIPPAQASGDPTTGTCTVTITDVTANLRNKSKSETATTQPFNDIVLSTVEIRYTWDDPALTTPNQIMDIGGTVPAGGTVPVRFTPIPLGEVTAAMAGHTASLDMLFSGVTVAGERVQADGGSTFSIGGSCN